MKSSISTGSGADAPADRRKRARLIVLLACGWAAFVALLFLWQAVSYRGLIVFLAEQQFNLFGRYYPLLSYLILTLLFGSPIFFFVRGRLWEPEAVASHATAAVNLLMGLRRFMRAMFIAAALCVLGAAVAALSMLTLPDMSGPVQTVDVAAQPLEVHEGATLLRGNIVYMRTAALTEDLWTARRETRFAPVVADASGRTIRYFVELRQDEMVVAGRPLETRRGILRRDGLPGELRQLFRYAGYIVPEPHYVLYASEGSLRWGRTVVASNLAIAALFFVLLGLWQLFVLHRTTRRLDGDAPASA
ncbi:hypothetical protein [Sphingomonas profundi]|uniref:hypothetical protein n=1 Tax=Alterirhizorhabdus profundi TaxID=2681549 RepID=UPI0012E7AB5B|nr:hypothetical protein [Sphingomonas profundi]